MSVKTCTNTTSPLSRNLSLHFFITSDGVFAGFETYISVVLHYHEVRVLIPSPSVHNPRSRAEAVRMYGGKHS
ncbi:hypothetical protein M404DRAFT_839489 [Pisolithus tinctorius Marx 270]|uniref:Uncharacterized protein n=1 Tax=Pisolithus tinctorius Marx 270 TaxID=870435 RepID=A0A0C3PC24_PISTI|nr:hypothetical protein M404DRAFT_839489 [Pisolithus tinctorius Marx 270]